MHLIRTQYGSQFYRFQDNSVVATECLTSKTPKINGKEVEVLQLVFIDGAYYNVYIEFIYVDKD